MEIFVTYNIIFISFFFHLSIKISVPKVFQSALVEKLEWTRMNFITHY